MVCKHYVEYKNKAKTMEYCEEFKSPAESSGFRASSFEKVIFQEWQSVDHVLLKRQKEKVCCVFITLFLLHERVLCCE